MKSFEYPAPALPSASVIAMRSGTDGLEVLLVRRAAGLSFAAGMWVFPGGRIDPGDGVGERAARMAALRELFEETGLLVAWRGGRDPVNQTLRTGIDRRYRDRLIGGRISFASILRREGLLARPRDLAPFAHWITPEPVPKRFDTLFYLVRAPQGQRVLTDGIEAVEARWASPAQMLADADANKAPVMFPTRMILHKLARAGGVAGAFALARSTALVPVMPRLTVKEGRRHASIPAEAGYGITEASEVDADMREGFA